MKNNNTSSRILWIARAGMIAALYIALTYLAMALGLDKGAVQIRFSEALIVLAFITPAAIPGLTIGCFLANLLTGCAILDVLLGPVATLIGAVGAFMISKMKNERASRLICTLLNILANTVIVPIVIYICYTSPSEQGLAILPYYALTVGAGEIISSGIMGTFLLLSAEKPIRRIL